MTSDVDLDDLLAAYAVDAVTDEERAGVDAMLADRADMRAELDELRAAAALLADDVAVEPPPGLRDRVLAVAAETPQEQPVAVLPRSSRGWLRPALVAAAAAVVLVLGFAAALLVVADRGGDRFADVLADPDAAVVELDGGIAESLRVVYSPGEDAAVVEGVGVDPLADQRGYQLWLVADGPPEPSVVFVPDRNGSVLVRVDGLDPTGAVLAVTDEPSTGSDRPTTPILAASA